MDLAEVTTKLGMANDGQDDTTTTWSDHTDVRPTILTLLGLQDMYVHDGRVLTEHMATNVQPVPLRGHTKTLGDFVQDYKQINAPFGQLGMDSLAVSSAAIASGHAHDDTTYTTLTNKSIDWTATRNSIAGQMRASLGGAAFNGQKFDENPREAADRSRAGAVHRSAHVRGEHPAVCAVISAGARRPRSNC